MERFWSKAEKQTEVSSPFVDTPCWVWTASTALRYGAFGIDGRTQKAHRVSWELTYGPIPDGLGVHHHCDNPPCVNPEHLWVGTQAENLAEMAEKGRGATGDKNGSRTHPEKMARGDAHWSRTNPEKLRPARGDAHWSRTNPEKLRPARGDANGARKHPERLARGEKNGRAKLTEAEAREIRASGMSPREAYKAYPHCPTGAADVAKGYTWKHIKNGG